MPINHALGLDKSNMFDTLLHLPDHIREAVSIGERGPRVQLQTGMLSLDSADRPLVLTF